MLHLCYHRDRGGSLPLRRALLEAHWDYMDRFHLVARGPTFAADETPSGSLHVVDLPDAAAARAFAFEEPGWQAGVYRDVLVRRWRDALGRTAAQTLAGRDGPWFLVLGLGSGAGADLEPPTSVVPVLWGSLLSDDGESWLGTAAIVPAGDADAARGILRSERYAEVEAHPWEPGGRR